MEDISCSNISVPIHIMELFSKKHNLNIIKFLADQNRPMRYKEIQKGLKINTRTLTDRLKELEDKGILIRNTFDEIPPRVEYEIVNIFEELKHLFQAMFNFNEALRKKEIELRA